jgi:hypothetical protein
MEMSMQPKRKRNCVADQAAVQGSLPDLPPELMDQLVKGPMTPTEVKGLMLVTCPISSDQ